MKINEAFPSAFLKAEDVGEDGTAFTITGVKLDTIGQGADAEQKPIVSFRETDKKLVLNKTNAGVIAEQHGDDTDEWLGKKVTLVAREVEFQGKVTWGIRIKQSLAAKKPLGGKTAPGDSEPSPHTPKAEDDIPF